jgi:hypothetical protein
MGRAQGACVGGVCGVGEEQHAEGVLGGVEPGAAAVPECAAACGVRSMSESSV